MGLDMNVYKEKDGVKEELHYWRKHYSIHDWFMGHCFAEEWGIPAEEIYGSSAHYMAFGGNYFELNQHYIDKLEQDILNNRMPEVDGESYDDFEGWILKKISNWKNSYTFKQGWRANPPEPTVDFIKKAKAALSDGYRLFYSIS